MRHRVLRWLFPILLLSFTASIAIAQEPYGAKQQIPRHRGKSNVMQQSDYYRRQVSRQPEEQPEPLTATVVDETSSLDYIALILLVCSIVALLIISKREKVAKHFRA